MLRKGLPRAFPGLEEVKGESVKEGTQYRSRVFMAPRDLVNGEQKNTASILLQCIICTCTVENSNKGH